MALHHPQNVLSHVLASNKPGCVLAATTLCAFGFDAANTQPLTLAQCVKAQTHMLANGSACCVFDRARFLGEVAFSKVYKWTLTNKANARRVFFLGVGQADLFCNLTDLCFK